MPKDAGCGRPLHHGRFASRSLQLDRPLRRTNQHHRQGTSALGFCPWRGDSVLLRAFLPSCHGPRFMSRTRQAGRRHHLAGFVRLGTLVLLDQPGGSVVRCAGVGVRERAGRTSWSARCLRGRSYLWSGRLADRGAVDVEVRQLGQQQMERRPKERAPPGHPRLGQRPARLRHRSRGSSRRRGA